MAAIELLTVQNLTLTIVVIYITRRALLLYEWLFVSPLSDLHANIWTLAFPIVGEYWTIRGKGFQRKHRLHSQYGSVWRMGPSWISVADPQLAHQIMKTDDLPKPERMYSKFKLLPTDPDTILTTSSRELHKMLRKLSTPAFSIKYLNNLEPYMFSVWESFEKKVLSLPSTGNGWRSVDMLDYFHKMAADIIGETAFGSSFGMVESGHHAFLEARRSMLHFAVQKRIFPFLTLIDHRLLPIGKSLSMHQNLLKDTVSNRVALNGSGQRRNDILQMLLDHRDPDTGESFDKAQIATSISLFNDAGSETTGNAMTWVLYFLLKYPDAKAKLQAELDAAFPDGLNSQMMLSTLKTLPFLDAVIKETLRLRPVAPTIAREFTEDMVVQVHEVDGSARSVHIPAGTWCDISFYAIHRSSQLWLRAEEFYPERWIEGSASSTQEEEVSGASQTKAEANNSSRAVWGTPKLVNRDAFWPFSAGTRDCIGKNFAYNEMRILLGHLVRRFDIVAGFDTHTEVEGASYITLSVNMKGGLPVKLKPRKK
ncbi:cytochrome P450 [Gonapodya prolifera JEL478]|uniref:Cytochrome P450 n=1 Tax=Gonapodya prolifera (strain JEL478) TaxID=1344416 RepID=A0A138ZZG8_GONPJ|nr:cytochrome P450 [Gonapodya prolifera JEL478]|eukprot:KXS09665.1 cytochrome P450 [Gonapodya prolifera JEL478]